MRRKQEFGWAEEAPKQATEEIYTLLESQIIESNSRGSSSSYARRYKCAMRDETGRTVLVRIYNKNEIAMEYSEAKFIFDRIARSISVLQTFWSCGATRWVPCFVGTSEDTDTIEIITEFVPENVARLIERKEIYCEQDAIFLLKCMLMSLNELHHVKNVFNTTECYLNTAINPSRLLFKPAIASDESPSILFSNTGDLYQADTLVGKTMKELSFLVALDAYSAPETIKHRKVSMQSNLWSIGCIFYEMVYGEKFTEIDPVLVGTKEGASQQLIAMQCLSENLRSDLICKDVAVSSFTITCLQGLLAFNEADRFNWTAVKSKIFALDLTKSIEDYDIRTIANSYVSSNSLWVSRIGKDEQQSNSQQQLQHLSLSPNIYVSFTGNQEIGLQSRGGAGAILSGQQSMMDPSASQYLSKSIGGNNFGASHSRGVAAQNSSQNCDQTNVSMSFLKESFMNGVMKRSVFNTKNEQAEIETATTNQISTNKSYSELFMPYADPSKGLLFEANKSFSLSDLSRSMNASEFQDDHLANHDINKSTHQPNITKSNSGVATKKHEDNHNSSFQLLKNEQKALHSQISFTNNSSPRNAQIEVADQPDQPERITFSNFNNSIHTSTLINKESQQQPLSQQSSASSQLLVQQQQQASFGGSSDLKGSSISKRSAIDRDSPRVENKSLLNLIEAHNMNRQKKFSPLLNQYDSCTSHEADESMMRSEQYYFLDDDDDQDEVGQGQNPKKSNLMKSKLPTSTFGSKLGHSSHAQNPEQQIQPISPTSSSTDNSQRLSTLAEKLFDPEPKLSQIIEASRIQRSTHSAHQATTASSVTKSHTKPKSNEKSQQSKTSSQSQPKGSLNGKGNSSHPEQSQFNTGRFAVPFEPCDNLENRDSNKLYSQSRVITPDGNQLVQQQFQYHNQSDNDQALQAPGLGDVPHQQMMFYSVYSTRSQTPGDKNRQNNPFNNQQHQHQQGFGSPAHSTTSNILISETPSRYSNNFNVGSQFQQHMQTPEQQNIGLKEVHSKFINASDLKSRNDHGHLYQQQQMQQQQQRANRGFQEGEYREATYDFDEQPIEGLDEDRSESNWRKKDAQHSQMQHQLFDELVSTEDLACSYMLNTKMRKKLGFDNLEDLNRLFEPQTRVPAAPNPTAARVVQQKATQEQTSGTTTNRRRHSETRKYVDANTSFVSATAYEDQTVYDHEKKVTTQTRRKNSLLISQLPPKPIIRSDLVLRTSYKSMVREEDLFVFSSMLDPIEFKVQAYFQSVLRSTEELFRHFNSEESLNCAITLLSLMKIRLNYLLIKQQTQQLQLQEQQHQHQIKPISKEEIVASTKKEKNIGALDELIEGFMKRSTIESKADFEEPGIYVVFRRHMFALYNALNKRIEQSANEKSPELKEPYDRLIKMGRLSYHLLVVSHYRIAFKIYFSDIYAPTNHINDLYSFVSDKIAYMDIDALASERRKLKDFLNLYPTKAIASSNQLLTNPQMIPLSAASLPSLPPNQSLPIRILHNLLPTP